MNSKIIVLDDDIFFRAKLQASLETGGFESVFTTDRTRLEAALTEAPRAVLVNLASRAAWAPLLALVRERHGAAVPIVGYAPHVRTELFERGLAQGCDDVVPNGSIAADAARIVREHGGAG